MPPPTAATLTVLTFICSALQHLVEELAEEAIVAADGSLFVQKLRRKRPEPDDLPEEGRDHPSSVLQAVQRTLMLQADVLLSLPGRSLNLEVYRSLHVML